MENVKYKWSLRNICNLIYLTYYINLFNLIIDFISRPDIYKFTKIDIAKPHIARAILITN